MHLRVKIEPPRQKREIKQCTKCQRYGHTKRFCYNIARCVKCIGNHATEACQREQADIQVQCVICNGNHPANYKGCEIYKQLQTKKFPRLRQRSSTSPHLSDPNPIPCSCLAHQHQYLAAPTLTLAVSSFLLPFECMRYQKNDWGPLKTQRQVQ